ncbi:TIGR03084 family metal-binding protein [Hoyosella sp. YIM 151337]|uniref:TIGR03084 family metal-binding protein n=1 Tax=Hoyosella sp. YIM 151337 TaxID=2992742 RepID=UPI0022362801|nr:TIGR03084 family metal-binding protein [Hoyosella sp. YIM 151337]MCW4351927.1 TIGR03084 family metal-binding protein [Hoyosella sp. YIM 151337]
MPDPSGVVASVVDDLDAEGAYLDELVSGLSESEWNSPTPATGWTIAHQIAHLAWTDDAAIAATTEPERFQALVTSAWKNPAGFVDDGAAEWAAIPPAELLERWRTGRAALSKALRNADPKVKLPWFGPPMSPASMATARIMETWAHGLDVADTLGIAPQPTSRIKHVAHIGVRTRDFAFALNQLQPPAEPFRVELVAPDGSVWVWGPDNASQRVTGTALDFCYLVTQRRHRADVDVRADGPDAEKWLTIAQAFAGPPGNGREPQSATDSQGVRNE